MKHLILFTLLFTFIVSCDSREKYNGTWFSNDNHSYIESDKIFIKDDSIFFSHPYFQFWNSYPLNIKGNILNFNNSNIKAEIYQDILTINDTSIFSRNPKEFYTYNFSAQASKLQMEFPKLKHDFEFDIASKNAFNYFIKYGKRHDNNEFNLLLNDLYCQPKDLLPFLSSGHKNYHEYFPNSILFIHKDAKMKAVEKIFLYHQAVNHIKVSFVNDISISVNDSLGIFYHYSGLTKKLPPILENDQYFEEVSNIQWTPPAPISLFPNFDNDNSTVIKLIDNNLLHNNTIINESELELIIKNSILKDKHIISLYDLNSDYSSFLNLNAIIDNSYQNIRNTESITIFNRSLEALNNDELKQIKLKVKYKHLWNYSIDHMQHLKKSRREFSSLII